MALKEEIIQEKAEVPYQETVIRCPGFPGKLFTGYWEAIGQLLHLNDITDRFRNERRFEFFFNSGVIGFEEFSELVSDSYDKREGEFLPR